MTSKAASSGGGGGEQLPELPPHSYLSALSPSLSLPPSPPLLSATIPSFTRPITSPSVTGGGRIQYTTNSTRGCAPSPNTMRRSFEFIRVSRQEWEHRDKLISSLRSENLELKTKLKNMTNDTHSYHKLLTTCQSLLTLLSDTNGGGVQDNIDIILTDKVNELHKAHTKSTKELTESNKELERVSSDLAAANIQLNNYKAQLGQAKVTMATKESETLQIKSELEVVQQAAARTRTMLESVKKQLTEHEEEKKREKQTTSSTLQQLGDISKQLKDKETLCELLEEQIKRLKNEKEEIEERATVADSAYEDMCYQLAESLQVEDECDVDGMMNKVCTLMVENEEMKRTVASLTNSSHLAEQDSRANRETIVKLVSDIKKLKEDLSKLPALQQTVTELHDKVQSLETDNKGLLERLGTSRDMVSSLKDEITSQQNNCNELKRKLETAHELHKTEKETKQKYTELLQMLSQLLSCSTTMTINEDSVKVKLQELNQCVLVLKNEIKDKELLINELRKQLVTKEEELVVERERNEEEREKLTEAKGHLHNIELIEKQLIKQQEKYQSFIKRCVTALQVEATTSSILSGEFAEDAVILKAEQLCHLETQTLAEKQSTVYSLQRKLKNTKQQLESKELHVNLLQRKVTALEERVTMATERETEMQSTMNKGQKMISQYERLQLKLSQQKELINELKKENESLTELKCHYTDQCRHVQQLEKDLQSLQDTRVHLSQQLADTRQKLHSAVSVDTDRADKCEENLKEITEELKTVKERENKLLLLKTNIKHLLESSSLHTTGGAASGGATVATEREERGHDDEHIITILRELIISCQRYKDLSLNLQSSLRHMETGFRNNYEDTLALLKNEL